MVHSPSAEYALTAIEEVRLEGCTLLTMTSRSGRGRWQRILDARREARAALGRDPDARDAHDAPPKRKTQSAPPPAPKPPVRHPFEHSEYVLTLGEAAARLGVNRRVLEAMIDAGKVQALPTGFTRTIPMREIERLTQTHS